MPNTAFLFFDHILSGGVMSDNAARLVALLKGLSYKPGYSFYVSSWDSLNYNLRIIVDTIDSQTNVQTEVSHSFPIPPYPMTDRELYRWVLQSLVMVETHEACEFFKIYGVSTFMPEHGPNANPYSIPL